MSCYDRREYQKPVPPFPMDNRQRKVKKNRTKLSSPPKDRVNLPIMKWEIFNAMTSSQKGIGRTECIARGSHDWTLIDWGINTETGRLMIGYVKCRRCGCGEYHR